VRESVTAIRRAGIDVIVCLLEERELTAELLDRYEATGLEVVRFPIRDFGVPDDPAAFQDLVEDLLVRLARGQRVLVHCLGGIGRTGTVIACLLKAAGEASDPVSVVRGIYHRGAVESPEQRRFVQEFAPRSGPPLRRDQDARPA
jgi:protein-tyrosine phosphatase